MIPAWLRVGARDTVLAFAAPAFATAAKLILVKGVEQWARADYWHVLNSGLRGLLLAAVLWLTPLTRRYGVGSALVPGGPQVRPQDAAHPLLADPGQRGDPPLGQATAGELVDRLAEDLPQLRRLPVKDVEALLGLDQPLVGRQVPQLGDVHADKGT